MSIFLGTFKVRKIHSSSFYHMEQFVIKIDCFYGQNHQQQQLFSLYTGI